ncbi:GNAT family N-acetyltransferase [Halobacillus sp. BBL2006]|uniref:GNAT family N-acetyltransferase n=1 Tax=Halobacillus sp. BBL2006 TaxID=1543706 RepID=UPI0005437DBA|nr:GNAT family N-acetyltransferase [Halobacillus sp. BBL2006]KHE66894.1 hypothetical protein LD39_20355 [Halobacillus sp. BBL2006]
MPLISERLYFRPYKDDDFEFLMSMLSDREMVSFIGDGEPKDRDGGKDFLNWIYHTYKVDDDLGLKVLVRKEDNTPVGHAGLVPQNIGEKQEIEIGYWICRNYRNNGYATESARALRNYGNEKLNIQRLIALIQPGHLASEKVAERIGMEFEKKIKIEKQEVNLFSVLKKNFDNKARP